MERGVKILKEPKGTFLWWPNISFWWIFGENNCRRQVLNLHILFKVWRYFSKQSRAWKKRHHQSVRANYTGSGEFFLLLAPTSSFPGCGHLATYLPHCLQWPSIQHKLCVNLAQWLNILRGDLANKLIREGCKRIMMMMTAAMGTMCCGGWDKINPWSVAANSRNRRREHLNSIFTPRWV